MIKADVLHLLWDGHLGGVQRYVLKVLKSSLWPKDIKHAVCFFSKGGQVVDQDMLDGISTFHLGLDSGWQFCRARMLEAIAHDLGVRVIHCHCDTPAFSMQLSKFSNYRLIFTEHGDTMLRTKNKLLTSLMWRFYGKYWDSVLCNSKYSMGDFVRRYPWMKSKSQVCLNPLLEIPPTTHDFNSSSHMHIGFFGRLVPHKGVDILIKAAVKLRAAGNDNFLVHIYGDGAAKESLKKQVKASNAQSYIHFEGLTDKPLEWMNKMDIVAVPSRTEPFGLVALEAQSAGVPVVGFDRSGVAEIVVDGQTGRVVAQGNISEYIRCLDELLKDKEKCSRMGHQARKRALKVFSLEQHIEQLCGVYFGKKDSSL